METVLTKNFALAHLSTYGAIIVMFTYSILLDRDFACTCKPQVRDCGLYLGLPIFLILFLILYTDKTFLRIWRHMWNCSSCSGGCRFRFCISFLSHILKATLTGLLWIAFVLLDGDWYVCCKNNHSEQQAHLACKATKNITYEDRVNIAELKNDSRVIGSFLLFAIICFAVILSLCRCRKCCQSSCYDRKNIYYKLILEEEENVLREILRESAKNKLNEDMKDRIRCGQWEECLDVAEKLIEDSTKPTLCDQQEEGERVDRRGEEQQQQQQLEQ